MFRMVCVRSVMKQHIVCVCVFSNEAAYCVCARACACVRASACVCAPAHSVTKWRVCVCVCSSARGVGELRPCPWLDSWRSSG